MATEKFGELPDGRGVQRISITGGGLSASIITWGAAIRDLRLAGHQPPLVLGFDSFDHYLRHSPYFGATAGRFANRIAGGRFAIDGKIYSCDTNFLGKHTLHGGAAGTGKRLWRLEGAAEDHVVLAYTAEDGEMGFPGTLNVTCRYSLQSGGRLVVELLAETDQPTLCNLAHHSYFNLEDGGRTDALYHHVQIDAAAYLPVDMELIPTGVVAPVDGGIFDFRSSRPIRNAEGAGHASYDHNFCLSAGRVEARPVARIRAPRSGVEMDVSTTEPGIQFYDGARVGREVPGLDGIAYRKFAGFCLEPQVWPDAPNRPYFPQALLHPGERYAQKTEYRFQKNTVTGTSG
ncbi:MAG: galactose mutarotase [Hyphomicrobiales bacterium]|nr:galactose mutarotase [Hyphomicrobiales bacterium]